MQKKVFLVLLLPLLIIPSIAFGINSTDSEIRIAEQQKKIDILEKQIAQKNLEYYWLIDIINSVLRDEPLPEKPTLDTT